MESSEQRETLSNIFLKVTSGHCVEDRLQEGRYRSMVTSWGLSPPNKLRNDGWNQKEAKDTDFNDLY